MYYLKAKKGKVSFKFQLFVRPLFPDAKKLPISQAHPKLVNSRNRDGDYHQKLVIVRIPMNVHVCRYTAPTKT